MEEHNSTILRTLPFATEQPPFLCDCKSSDVACATLLTRESYLCMLSWGTACRTPKAALRLISIRKAKLEVLRPIFIK